MSSDALGRLTISSRTVLPVTVRPAVLEDAGEVADRLAELGYATPADLVAEKLSAFAASRADAVLVAADATFGTVLGVASVHVLPLFHAPGNLARLTALAVRRSAQRRQIGRALVEAAEAFAWETGCVRIEVTSGDHRLGTHAFYRAIGYIVDERRFIKSAQPAAQLGAAPDLSPQPGGSRVLNFSACGAKPVSLHPLGGRTRQRDSTSAWIQ